MLLPVSRNALGLYLFVICTMPSLALADEAVWQRLGEGGHIVLMRHATTEPGIGDPPGFDLNDCTSQRNLSAAGIEQAQRIGATLRARKIPIGDVRSSRWCRCRDTALHVFAHAAEPWPLLDSYFEERARGAAQTAALREALDTLRITGNLFLVTHQINIRGLTGQSLAQGEMLVLTKDQNGELTMVGRIPPP